VAAGQSQQFYSGVGIFNWHYPSSPPQILRVPVAPLESRGQDWHTAQGGPRRTKARHGGQADTCANVNYVTEYRKLILWHSLRLLVYGKGGEEHNRMGDGRKYQHFSTTTVLIPHSTSTALTPNAHALLGLTPRHLRRFSPQLPHAGPTSFPLHPSRGPTPRNKHSTAPRPLGATGPCPCSAADLQTGPRGLTVQWAVGLWPLSIKIFRVRSRSATCVSPRDSSPAPGVFYARPYSRARRLRLEKPRILYLGLSRSPSAVFF
jgi:hypothetical protein